MLPVGMRLRLWHLVCHREEFWDLFTSLTFLDVQYIATEQLFNRSHQEQQVGPQENEVTERYKECQW